LARGAWEEEGDPPQFTSSPRAGKVPLWSKRGRGELTGPLHLENLRSLQNPAALRKGGHQDKGEKGLNFIPVTS